MLCPQRENSVTCIASIWRAGIHDKNFICSEDENTLLRFMSQKPQTMRMPLDVSPEVERAVSKFRHEHGFKTGAAALRKLIQIGLAHNEEQPSAVPIGALPSIQAAPNTTMGSLAPFRAGAKGNSFPSEEKLSISARMQLNVDIPQGVFLLLEWLSDEYNITKKTAVTEAICDLLDRELPALKQKSIARRKPQSRGGISS